MKALFGDWIIFNRGVTSDQKVHRHNAGTEESLFYFMFYVYIVTLINGYELKNSLRSDETTM